MFTRIFKPKGSSPIWLGPKEPHLYNLTLENVSDPFDSDALWDDQYSIQKEIVNLQGENQNSRKRLKQALDDHRINIPENDGTGRMLARAYTCTDVVVWIPKHIWLEDVAAGATRIKMLAYNLAKHHYRDFEGSLYRGRVPNYVVMPREGLTASQVMFQFGRGVFVPKDSDQMASKLQFELILHNYDLTNRQRMNRWIFFLDGANRAERKIGLYEDQGSLLISLDCLLQKKVSSPFQFVDNQGYILINQIERGIWESFYVENENWIHMPKRANQDGSSTFVHRQGKLYIDHKTVEYTLNLILTPLGAYRSQAQAQIQQEAKPVQQKPEKAAAEMQNRAVVEKAATPPDQNSKIPHEAQADDEMVDVPKMFANTEEIKPDDIPLMDAVFENEQQVEVDESVAKFGVTIIPNRGTITNKTFAYSLVAEGIALPRIDGKFTIKDLESWYVWLDDQGNPINSPSVDPNNNETVTTLHANKKAFELKLRRAGKKEFEVVEALPYSMELGGNSLEIAPSPFDNWLGILQFANPFAYCLESKKKYLIGRHNPDNRGQQADIQLDQVSHPHSLVWASDNDLAESTIRTATFASLGLSRQHAWVSVSGTQLNVRLAKGHRLYYYNKELDFGKHIDAGSEDQVSLGNGDRIIIGNYVLRFDRLEEKSEAKMAVN